MFTGIIKEIGVVKKITRINTGLEIEVACKKITADMKLGDSIAVNGCCLTVKEFNQAGFKADISFSTLKFTTFASASAGERVNLEDAVSLKDKLGGHIITGHIDDVGKIADIRKIGDFYKVTVKIPNTFLEFTAPKGSCSIDGISLTISEVIKNNLIFAVIPFTFENTNFKFKNISEKVNLEVDLMARYIINMARYSGQPAMYSLKGETFTSSAAIDYLKMLNINEDLKNISKDKDENLEEKLKKYGFK
ncbi:MAG: riboflavin synthase [Actinomycetota bacterium]|jgi:riboflavin synthase|nr:riboflavin synthase [Actinomycetota bacterium]